MHNTAPMDQSSTALAVAIGNRVKQERHVRGWTLEYLAESSRVSRRMLINIEQGATNPSIGTLLKISNALGVGLPALVEPPQINQVRVTRSGEGAALWTSDAGGRGVLVASCDFPDVIELWDWTMVTGDQHISDAHTQGTRELLLVQQGRLLVTIGEQVIQLNAGDALSFPGDVAHAYTNPDSNRARFSLAVFEPGTGSRSRSETRNA